MARVTVKKLIEMTDELGELKAEISKLKEREEELKQVIIDSDRPWINGKLFRVTVSDGVRITLDQDAVRQILTPKQLKSVEVTTPITTVRVSARIG